MKCKGKEQEIINYFEDSCSVEECNSLLTHIRDCQHCKTIFEEYQLIYNTFAQTQQAEPGSDLNEKFYHFLDKEKAKESNTLNFFKLPKQNAALYAFVRYAAILIIGLFIGLQFKTANEKQQFQNLQNEIHKTREIAVLAMLQNESSSTRIEAVGYTNSMEVNSEIVNALIHTFQTDSNLSVRLAALNALSNFKENQEVQQVFIQALTNQSDPRIQLRLIDILVETENKEAVPGIFKMLQDNNLNTIVKNKAEEGIGTLL